MADPTRPSSRPFVRRLRGAALLALLAGLASTPVAPTAAAAERQADYDSYLAHVAAAAAHLRLHETAAVHRWLEAAPEEHRGWEWHWLWGASHQAAERVPISDEPIASVAWSPDGDRLAIATRSGTVSVRPAAGLAHGPDLELVGHDKGVHSVVWSPDGGLLATASSDRTVRLWDAATGEPVRTWNETGRGVAGLAFDATGLRLAYASWDRSDARGVWGLVRIFDLAGGDEIAYLEHDDKPIRAVAFSSDGAHLAAGSWGGSVAVWALRDGAPAAEAPARVLIPPESGGYQAVQSIAFRPGTAEGSRPEHLAVASRDGRVRVWDAAAGTLVWTAGDGGIGHGKDVNALAYSPDGRRLVTGSTDTTLRFWDADDGSARGVLHGPTAPIGTLAVTSDGRRIAAGAADGSVEVFALASPPEEGGPVVPRYGARHEWRHPSAVYDVAWRPDGARVATASYLGWLTVWDPATGERVLQHQTYEEPDADPSLNSVSYTPDGSRLVTGSNQGRLDLRDSATGETVETLSPGAVSQRIAAAVSPDGSRVASPGEGPALEIWRLPPPGAERAGEASLERRLEGKGPVRDAVWTPDGRFLAAADLAGGVALWDAAAGTPVLELPDHPGGASALAVSPDGRRLATGAVDGTVRLFELPSGRQTATVEVHDSMVWSVRFSPDGRRLATASFDFTVGILDPATGTVVLTLPFERSAAYAGFSPDGRSLAVALFDGTVRLLPGGAEEPADAAPSRPSR